MSAWPNQLGGNQFDICRLDPEKPMLLEVRTWSSVCGEGGSVTVDGFDAGGKRHSSSFASISIESNRSVADERAYLQELVDEFKTDLEGNWRAMVSDARAKVAAYYKREAENKAEAYRKALEGDFS